jgi:hypothetical protein
MPENGRFPISKVWDPLFRRDLGLVGGHRIELWTSCL